VDHVWGTEQPERPENAIVPLELEFAGISWESKVADVRVQGPILQNFHFGRKDFRTIFYLRMTEEMSS
jgi:hypothetical protein